MGMMCDDDDYDYEAENEAFNIIERKQGGFQIKREMAKHKLTDEEIDEIWGKWMRPYAHMVMTKLKEKNT